MKKIIMAVLSVTAMLFVNTAQAELMVNPTASAENGEMEGGVALSFSSISYEVPGDNSDVDRKMLSAYGAMNVQDEIDIFGALGYTFQSELDGRNGDDTGFALAGGVRATLPIDGDFKVRGYGQLFYFDEDYGNSLSGTGIELSLGVLAIKEIEELKIYGGVELVPFDDSELKGNLATIDLERDNIFGLRVGANYQLNDQLLLRGELALISETTVTVGLSMPF